ncbi:hypothetical protein I6G82_02860 [Lysinibacillus macroides]|uniref:Uncharacterized protein n=1 Tax=Lysinibacillus macroides TaxID=33935 RepID=A0A0N1J048_9BACI|nr:hypothetical protein [Lysinibacillus macroides]KOY81254.1 hypothetical protein ADM90_19125 [Lysinibacillus macroides]QPR68589.1 hypothetical protein I6G82_02860 [Lysinibacillus macroides]
MKKTFKHKTISHLSIEQGEFHLNFTCPCCRTLNSLRVGSKAINGVKDCAHCKEPVFVMLQQNDLLFPLLFNRAKAEKFITKMRKKSA